MDFRNIFFGAVLLFAFNLVLPQSSHQNNFNLQGDLKNLVDGTKIVLSLLDARNRSFHPKDSTFASSESFTFRGKINRDDSFILTFYDNSSNKYINQFSLFLDGPEIRIQGDFNNLEKRKVEGSRLYKISNEINEKLEWSINQRKKNNWTIEKQQFELGKKIKTYIFKKPNNSISLERLLRMSSNVPRDSLKLFYSKLDPDIQSSKRGIVLKNTMLNKTLQVGDHFEDFESEDLDGNIVRLSDFKGQVLMIDFWASWCIPCHAQNQNEVPRLIQEFKNKDLVVISYSVDDSKEKWVKSSLADNISWVNISNLQGLDDKVRIKYGVKSYPTNILIDRKGIIRHRISGAKEGVLEKELGALLMGQ